MILTVTLNAAIDRTVAVPSFQVGRRHRAVESSSQAGGKGINVARAISRLGRPVIATGLVGGSNGDRVVEQLQDESVLCDFTRIAQSTRTNLAVTDPTTGLQTEINERGPSVTEAELEAFFERFDYLVSGARICVIAGSLPPDVDVDTYARMIRDLKKRDILVLLDSYGAPMNAGLRAGPAIITPNQREAEELVGHEFESREEMLEGLSELTELGAGEAVITLPNGCLASMVDDGERIFYEVETEALEPISRVGSGDAFVAGYVSALFENATRRECLAYGVACGAESTQHFGAGTVDRARAERILDQVEVREVELPATLS